MWCRNRCGRARLASPRPDFARPDARRCCIPPRRRQQPQSAAPSPPPPAGATVAAAGTARHGLPSVWQEGLRVLSSAGLGVEMSDIVARLTEALGEDVVTPGEAVDKRYWCDW